MTRNKIKVKLVEQDHKRSVANHNVKQLKKSVHELNKKITTAEDKAEKAHHRKMKAKCIAQWKTSMRNLKADHGKSTIRSNYVNRLQWRHNMLKRMKNRREMITQVSLESVFSKPIIYDCSSTDD